jgi:hypothetical protein
MNAYSYEYNNEMNESDDLRRTAGRSWMRVAEDRVRWREIGETYVRQWTVAG